MTLHTDIPTRSELEQLLAVRDPLCVSVYIPTSPFTHEAQGARIELKTLTANAMRQLQDLGAARRARVELREPLEELVDDDLLVRASPQPGRVRRAGRHPDVPAGEPAHERGGSGRPLLRQAAVAGDHVSAGRVRARARCGGVRVVEVAAEGPSYAVDVPGLPADLAGAVGAVAERRQSERFVGPEDDTLRLRQFARKVESGAARAPRRASAAADPGGHRAAGLDLSISQQLPGAGR
jgi:hypothetical protein